MSTSTRGLYAGRHDVAERERCMARGAVRFRAEPSDAPTAGMVATAIKGALQQFGVRGCISRMAQEFGDHPDAAARRMRWVHGLAAAS